MEIFVARQPILTINENVVGYELLYRNSHKNCFSEVDGDKATIDLLLNSFVNIGNEKLSNGKMLFINFTKNLLLKRVPLLFSPEKIVIEILEEVEGDDEIIEAIKEFKQLGYMIALDDFCLTEKNRSLLPYATIIKVDFLNTTFIQRQILRNTSKSYNITLLAEKIETRENFQKACNEGFQLFQGYFFSKPAIITDSEIPFYADHYLDILNELQTVEPCVDKISRMIECDLSLSYKILKIVNTLSYYTRVKVTSIKQAVLMLGLNEIGKLISIITLKEHHVKLTLSNEIIVRSLIRAKVAEQIGSVIFNTNKKPEFFMLGMFSLLDALLKQPMNKILKNLPLSDNVKNALIGEKSDYELIITIIFAMEKGDWEKLQSLAPILSSLNLTSCYQDAIDWATNIYNFLIE